MFFVTGNYLKSNLSQDKTQNKSSDSNNAVDGSSNATAPKPVKGVRFKESFLTIPRPPSEAFGDEIYDHNTSAAYSSNNDNGRNDTWLEKSSQSSANLKKISGENVFNVNGSKETSSSKPKGGSSINNRPPGNSEFTDQVKLRKSSGAPLQRRYSNESLVSNNSVMMHTGTLIHASAIDDLALNQQPYQNKSSLHGVLVPSQPDRPAPVLKPAVGRKPSLDRSSIFQIRKQQSIAQQKTPDASKCSGGGAKPTYEDTLKKCQSLTRHHSSPPSPNPSMNGGQDNQKINASRQSSCPTTSMSTPSSPGVKYTPIDGKITNIEASPNSYRRLQSPPKSPAIPPKPDLAMLKSGFTNRQIRTDNVTKNIDSVKHLPPSGNYALSSQQKNLEPMSSSKVNNHRHPSSIGNSHLSSVNDSTSVIPPLNNRQHQLNQAFLNDLHLAMSAKLASQDAASPKSVVEKGLSSVQNPHHHQKIVNASVNNWLMNQTSFNNGRPPNIPLEGESPPFPVNRFSNGEYDNIQTTNVNSSMAPQLSMNPSVNPNHLIKPSGVAKAVKILPSAHSMKSNENTANRSGGNRPPTVSGNQRIKKMAPPPPTLTKRTKENDACYSNWNRS